MDCGVGKDFVMVEDPPRTHPDQMHLSISQIAYCGGGGLPGVEMA